MLSPKTVRVARQALFSLVGTCCLTPSAEAQQPSANDSTAVLRGIVVAREAQLPLSYSVVTLLSTTIEQFSDERGRFTLMNVPPGTFRLRVKHLGFAPQEITVVLAPGRADSVRIELPRIAVRLATVRVRSDVECRTPGPPNAEREPDFAMVFEQLRQNAERLRLVSDGYPFVYRVEQTYGSRSRSGLEHVQRTDTVSLHSRERWRYSPGRVVTPPRRGVTSEYSMNLPTLLDFADTLFQKTHCFTYGGIEAHPEGDMLRVDFRADHRIRDPDVDGAIYLDTATYQIRRSVVRLTSVPRQVRNLLGVTASSTFAEVVEGVPVIDIVSAENVVRAPRARDPIVALTEQHRLLEVLFVNVAPPGVPLRR